MNASPKILDYTTVHDDHKTNTYSDNNIILRGSSTSPVLGVLFNSH